MVTGRPESGSGRVIASDRKILLARGPQQREFFSRTQREDLPPERAAIIHKFSVARHTGYLTVGNYPDGRPGEIFIITSKEGSTLSGVMDGLAMSLSIGLQDGVPLKVVVDKLVNTRFEPAGTTANPNIRFASSVLDYIARWLGARFVAKTYSRGDGASSTTPVTVPSTLSMDEPHTSDSSELSKMDDGVPACSECGMLITIQGSCYVCANCGATKRGC